MTRAELIQKVKVEVVALVLEELSSGLEEARALVNAPDWVPEDLDSDLKTREDTLLAIEVVDDLIKHIGAFGEVA
jgi:hypothetical protein